MTTIFNFADMEWLDDDTNMESMEVDIGYMPQMEIISTGPSKSANYSQDEDNVMK